MTKDELILTLANHLYATFEILQRHAERKTIDMPVCRHCHRPRSEYSRGLCATCFKAPEIVAMYPPKVATTPGKNYRRGYEPSLEELEQLIQERYPTMPARGVEE